MFVCNPILDYSKHIYNKSYPAKYPMFACSKYYNFGLEKLSWPGYYIRFLVIVVVAVSCLVFWSFVCSFCFLFFCLLYKLEENQFSCHKMTSYKSHNNKLVGLWVFGRWPPHNAEKYWKLWNSDTHTPNTHPTYNWHTHSDRHTMCVYLICCLIW